MKNRIILVMVLVALSFSSEAQFYLGAKVGLNMANITGSFPNMAFNKKIGINGGATLKYNFANYFGAQMDFLYSQMGSKSKQVTITDDGAGGTMTTVDETIYDFSYLQIPIYANWEFPIRTENLLPYRKSETVVSIHLHAGGYFGYGLGAKETNSSKTTTVDVDGNTTIDVAPKDNLTNILYNPIDFGMAFGAGFSFKLSSKGRLTIDGRYLMGLSNLNTVTQKKAATAGLLYGPMKNKAPQVEIGYIHRISRLKRWQIMD